MQALSLRTLGGAGSWKQKCGRLSSVGLDRAIAMRAEGEDDFLAAALFEERPSRLSDAAILAGGLYFVFGFRV